VEEEGEVCTVPDLGNAEVMNSFCTAKEREKDITANSETEREQSMGKGEMLPASIVWYWVLGKTTSVVTKEKPRDAAFQKRGATLCQGMLLWRSGKEEPKDGKES